MRRSHFFLLGCGILIALFALMAVHSALARRALMPALHEQERLVQELGLTDLCLATEANYTRHLSQADISTAFQDHPISLEHFPSGTWLQPNPRSRHGNGQHNRTTKKHP